MSWGAALSLLSKWVGCTWSYNMLAFFHFKVRGTAWLINNLFVHYCHAVQTAASHKGWKSGASWVCLSFIFFMKKVNYYCKIIWLFVILVLLAKQIASTGIAECDTLFAEWEIHHGHYDSVKTNLLISNKRYTMKLWKELTQANNQRDGAPVLSGKAERVVFFQPGDDKALSRL